MGDGQLSKAERYWVNTFSLQLQATIDRAVDTASAGKQLTTAKAFQKANPLVGAVTTGLTAYFEEFDATGNLQRSRIKSVLLGTTVLAIGVVAATVAGPASLVFAGGTVATYLGAKVIGQIFDVISNAFGLFYDSTLDFPDSGSAVRYSATGLADKVTGSDYDDRIFGNGADDRIKGGGGDDHLFGGRGADRLYGGDGNDDLYGGAGKKVDILRGGDGRDWLDGGRGADDMRGGAGDDKIVVRDAKDIAYGGVGNDWVVSELTSVDLTSRFFHSIENVLLGVTDVGPSAAVEAYGTNKANKLTGNANNNKIDGRAGNDQIWGSGGDDELIGGRGRDTIKGGSGDDTIKGGRGGDFLFGDDGDDTFILNNAVSDVVDGGDDDDMFIVAKGYNHVIDGGEGWDIVDLRGLDLEKLNPDNFRNIEEIWTDDVLITPVALNLQKVKLFGKHEQSFNFEGPLPDMYLFGGADLELSQGASLKMSFVTKPVLGHDVADYDTTEMKRVYHNWKHEVDGWYASEVKEVEVGNYDTKTNNGYFGGYFSHGNKFTASQYLKYNSEGTPVSLGSLSARAVDQLSISVTGIRNWQNEETFLSLAHTSYKLGMLRNETGIVSHLFSFPREPEVVVAHQAKLFMGGDGELPEVDFGTNALTFDILFM